jgi:hypothetical protein
MYNVLLSLDWYEYDALKAQVLRSKLSQIYEYEGLTAKLQFFNRQSTNNSIEVIRYSKKLYNDCGLAMSI